MWYCSKCFHGNKETCCVALEVWDKTDAWWSSRSVLTYLYFKVLSYFPQWSNISCRSTEDHPVHSCQLNQKSSREQSVRIKLINVSNHPDRFLHYATAQTRCCSVNVPSSVSSVRDTAGGFFILRLRMKTWLSVSRWLTVRHRVYMEVNSAGNKTPPAAAAGTTGLWSEDKTHLSILRLSPSRWRTRRAPCVKFYVQQLKNREKEINGGKNQDPAGVCVCVCVKRPPAETWAPLSPLSPLLLSEELRVVFWSSRE